MTVISPNSTAAIVLLFLWPPMPQRELLVGTSFLMMEILQLFLPKTKLIVSLFLTWGVMEEFSKNNSSQHGENLKSPLATWRK
jgi:hypothetical protein